jgi:hypothetical protein
MWVFTDGGFYSAVQHWDNPDMLVVRSRTEADARYLADWMASQGATVTVHHTPKADYGWRVMVSKTSFAMFLVDKAESIDYPNFKSAVAERQGHDRAMVYGGVWETLLALQYPKVRHDW